MMEMTVTVYNRYGNDNPTRWGRHVLHGVHFRAETEVSLSAAGASGGHGDSLLLVPFLPDYVSPEAYQAAADKAGIWTLQEGDLILPGEGPAPGHGDIRRDISGCKRITGVVSHCYGSPLDHWEVTAR